MRHARLAAALLLASVAAAGGHAVGASLATVATFEHQVTCVTVGRGDRLFVNFPRWTEDSPVSVAEVMPDGSTRPFPDARWNSWRNATLAEFDPALHWVCVQSVVAGPDGNLWVLDPGAPAADRVLPGAPKLVKIDLATNAVAQHIGFDPGVAPPSSYLNDVRFSPDGRHAFITDSGRGALVVVDLAAGTARRVLDGHPSIEVEKGVVVHTDGRPLRRQDGRGPMFAADGMALSKDGAILFWQALTGATLYSLPTAALTDPGPDDADLAARIRTVGRNGVADGLLVTADGRMVITAPERTRSRSGSATPRRLCC